MALRHRRQVAADPVGRSLKRPDSPLHAPPHLVKRPVAAALEDLIVESVIRLVELARGTAAGSQLHPADERLEPAQLLRVEARNQERGRKFFQSGPEGRSFPQGPLAEVQNPRAAIGELGHQAIAFQQEQGVSDRSPASLHLLGDARLYQVSPGLQTTPQNGLTQAIGNLFRQRAKRCWP